MPVGNLIKAHTSPPVDWARSGSGVVNALSEELVATIRKDGCEYRQTYRRGKVTSDLKKVRECRGSRTSIQFN